jgi:hypothetical protein
MRAEALPFFGTDTSNYRVVYGPKAGWKDEPHGPQTLFLYRHPEESILIRGAVNQVVSDINPTPELHTDALAQYYIDRTRENMPGWKAELLDRVPARNTWFRLVHRERDGKVVVTAYAVKGNTTLLISMSGNGDDEKLAVSRNMDGFKNYLSTVSLERMSEYVTQAK